MQNLETANADIASWSPSTVYIAVAIENFTEILAVEPKQPGKIRVTSSALVIRKKIAFGIK